MRVKRSCARATALRRSSTRVPDVGLRARPPESGTTIPFSAASARTASGNESPSCSMSQPNTLPPFPQPKHLKVRRSGFTVNEGVFSSWNGQSAFQARPIFFERQVAPDHVHDVVGGEHAVDDVLGDLTLHGRLPDRGPETGPAGEVTGAGKKGPP